MFYQIPLNRPFQGKYVEIQFGRGGEPDGGKISNFLLEKVTSYSDLKGNCYNLSIFYSLEWSVWIRTNEIFTFFIRFVLGQQRKCRVTASLIYLLFPFCSVNHSLLKWSYHSGSLGLTTPDYYYYLNQSGVYEVEGTDDAKEFQDTLVCY